MEETQGYCPVFHRAVELIGRRWNGPIIGALLDGADRFGEIRSRIPGLTDRLLAQRLRELEREGVVHADDQGPLPGAGDRVHSPMGCGVGTSRIDQLGAGPQRRGLATPVSRPTTNAVAPSSARSGSAGGTPPPPLEPPALESP